MKRQLIDLITKTYLKSKSKLREHELGVTNRNNNYLDHYRVNVYHIEHVVSCLSDNDKFIIDNEVLKGKRGNWYFEYMSTPTYYRHRNRAYDNFLKNIE